MNVQRNSKSARRDPKFRSTAAGRQPFADLSNFNLTPIETLRKLCSPSETITTTTGTYSSNPDSAVLKSPISVSQSDSKSWKPYVENSAEVKSDTSVGSSSFVRLREASKFSLSALSRSSLKTSASADDELGVYGQRESSTRSNWKKEARVLPCSTLRESKRGKEDRDTCLPHESNKENKQLTGTGNMDNGKEIAENHSSPSAKIKQDRGKKMPGSLIFPPPKNNKSRGTTSLSINSPHENPNKEKEILHHVRGKPTMGTLDDETMAKKASVLPLKTSPQRKTRERKKPDRLLFSCPPLPRTKNKSVSEDGDAESSRSMTDPKKICSKKRRTGEQSFSEFVLPKEFVEKQRAYFKEVDDFELEEEEEESDGECL